MARRVASELFVSRLSFYVTTGELERLFSPFGLVEQVRLVKDPRTQRPKGFGFVKFASEIDAQNALKAMNGRAVIHRPSQMSPSLLALYRLHSIILPDEPCSRYLLQEQDSLIPHESVKRTQLVDCSLYALLIDQLESTEYFKHVD